MKRIPRESNLGADRFSRIIDFYDYTFNVDVFLDLDFRLVPHTVDSFACVYNTKLVALILGFISKARRLTTLLPKLGV